jgi:SAM-dependent methyltransferase
LSLWVSIVCEKSFGKEEQSYVSIDSMKLCLACNNTFHSADWRCLGCAQEPVTVGNHLSFAPHFSAEHDTFPADAHQQLFELEASHFWFRARNALILWALQTYFPNVKSFFEIGCGTGFVLSGIKASFPAVQLSGSEIFERGLSLAELRLPGVELYQMDARRIPFRDHFDVIGAFDVLEHIEEDETVLQEMFGAARAKTGGVIITVPQHKFLWSAVDDHACHVRRYSASDLRIKLEHAGFQILKITSFNSFLLPLMAFSRFIQRQRPGVAVDPLAEFRVPRWINSGLEAAMNCERLSIEMGASYPAGGSLLAVARVKGG